MPELLQRVERLERQNARLRGLLIITLVTVASFAAVRQDVLPFPLRTSEIIIAAPDAATKAVLGLTEDGAPVLRFYDEQGHARIVISVTPNGPRLVVTDEGGKPRDIFGYPKLVPLTQR